MKDLFSEKWARNLAVVVCGLIILLGILIYFSTAPGNFPSDTIVKIDKGLTLSQTAELLHEKGVIRSPFLFKAVSVLMGSTKSTVFGSYAFSKPESVLRVAYRASKGQFGLTPIKITIPEGTSSNGVANVLKQSIPEFDVASFKILARQNEGYLFPDTYYFYKNSTPEEVIKQMRDTFDIKIADVKDDIGRFGKSESDIITMASIIEKEGTDNVDRRIIAGILWKRIEKGMPLQVDAPFYYIFGKTSSELTANDLATSSLYNLYKNKGLTPTPITNPGLEAIVDAMTPTPTKYMFYLSDMDGEMHYAVDFDGHIANRQKYMQ